MHKQPVLYTPYNDRTPSTCYRSLVDTVFHKGTWKKVIHGEPALTYNGFELRYQMSNGFPIITERKLTKKMIQGAMAEHIGFLHGADTLEALMSFGMDKIFWERWVNDEKKSADFGLKVGELGPASYGAAWTRFPKPDGTTFNQIEDNLRVMKKEPFRRTFFITPWIPYWIHPPERRVQVAPCHGWIQVTLFPEEKFLNINHYQRSGDILVGVPLNLIHYSLFGLMLGHELGYRFNEYVHYIADAHIYKRQIDHAKELLATRDETKEKLPSVILTDVGLQKDFFSLRVDDFIISDYIPQVEKYIPIDTPV